MPQKRSNAARSIRPDSAGGADRKKHPMNHRQRLAQIGVAFLLTAAGLVIGVAILGRALDHPDFRAVTA